MNENIKSFFAKIGGGLTVAVVGVAGAVGMMAFASMGKDEARANLLSSCNEAKGECTRLTHTFAERDRLYEEQFVKTFHIDTPTGRKVAHVMNLFF